MICQHCCKSIRQVTTYSGAVVWVHNLAGIRSCYPDIFATPQGEVSR